MNDLMSQVKELNKSQVESFEEFLKVDFIPNFLNLVKSSENNTVYVKITKKCLPFRVLLCDYLIKEGFDLTVLTCGTNPRSYEPFCYKMITQETDYLMTEGLGLLVSWI